MTIISIYMGVFMLADEGLFVVLPHWKKPTIPLESPH
jgi:hypothetical protein